MIPRYVFSSSTHTLWCLEMALEHWLTSLILILAETVCVFDGGPQYEMVEIFTYLFSNKRLLINATLGAAFWPQVYRSLAEWAILAFVYQTPPPPGTPPGGSAAHRLGITDLDIKESLFYAGKRGHQQNFPMEYVAGSRPSLSVSALSAYSALCL